MPKVECSTIARAMKIEAEARLQGEMDEKFDAALKVKASIKDGSKTYFYSNSMMKETLKLASL